MNSLFWSRLHGGATHFPIALIFASALFDALGFFLPRSPGKCDFNATGYWLVLLSALGSFGAVFTGLALNKWRIGGAGLVLRHHLFVWPAFALLIGLATWRLMVGKQSSRRTFAIYLCVVVIACALVATSGFFAGELLLGR